MKWSAKFHLQSIARRTLLGTESQNPSLAAKSLLGAGSLRRGESLVRRAQRRLRRRSFHRGNPVPAIVATLLGGLGKRFEGPAAKHAARVAQIQALAERALNNDASALAELDTLSRTFATTAAKNAAKQVLAAVRKELADRAELRARETASERRAAQREAGAAAAAREGRFLEAGSTIASAIGQAALRGGRGRRRRTTRRRSYSRTSF